MKIIEDIEGEYSGYYLADCEDERIIVAVAKILGVECRHESWEPFFPEGFSLPDPAPFVVDRRIGRTFEIRFRGTPSSVRACGQSGCCQRLVKIAEVLYVRELHDSGG